MEKNSDIGKEIAKYVNAGNIVPIKIAIQTIVNAIKKCSNTYNNNRWIS